MENLIGVAFGKVILQLIKKTFMQTPGSVVQPIDVACQKADLNHLILVQTG